MSKEPDPYLDNLYKAYNYCVEQFDKYVLYISSGALGVSFSFIEKIVPLATAKYKYILIASWYILGAVILFALFTHYLSFRYIDKYIKSYNADDDQTVEKLRIQFNKWLRFFNVILIVLLVSGISLLVLFVQKNIF